MKDFICKIASIREMEEKWNYEIDRATDDKQNWIIWKKENINNYPEYKNKLIYEHYGFDNYIKKGNELYPDGTVIEVEYYKIKNENISCAIVWYENILDATNVTCLARVPARFNHFPHYMDTVLIKVSEIKEDKKLIYGYLMRMI